MTLTDHKTTSSIKCKLWNKNVDGILDTDLSRVVTVTNVLVDIFNDVHSVDSTDLTEIQVRLNTLNSVSEL